MSSYSFVLAEAERRHNRKALKELRAIGEPPHTVKRMMVQRKWLVRFVGIVRGMSLWKFFRIVLSGPESSIFGLPNNLRGQLFSVNAMWTEISALNLVKTVPALQMPVFLFIGRHCSGNECSLFRQADCPVEETHLVRGIRTRAGGRGACQVQHGHGELGAAQLPVVSDARSPAEKLELPLPARASDAHCWRRQLDKEQH